MSPFLSGKVSRVNSTMMSLARMPYTDTWRIKALNLSHTCEHCTFPTSAGRNLGLVFVLEDLGSHPAKREL